MELDENNGDTSRRSSEGIQLGNVSLNHLARSNVRTFFDLSRGVAFFSGLLLLFTAYARSAEPQVLRGCMPKAVPLLQPTGRLPGTNRLNLAIGLPLRNREALTNLLRQIYDPACPNYRHYLTPGQFTERFGPTEEDYQAVIAFAKANGLAVTARHPNRMLVDVNGAAADIEKALHVTMRTYRHPRENRTFFAPDTEPSLDLEVSVLNICGLDDYSLPHPRLQATLLANAGRALPDTGSGPSGTYLGKDFRAAYIPSCSLDGSGQTVGLLEFDGYTASDITYYESRAGLPGITLSNVLVDGASGLPGGGEVEVSLDIEVAIAMATNLSQVVVYMAPNPSPWEDLLNRMANDNLAKQLSCSWYQAGAGADPAADQIFQQMAAQGQSFFSASGDSDADVGLIDFPGDTPYLTQVGGTTLTTSGPGGSWVSEKVWNWGSGVGSGGGISTQYPIPSWQMDINMADNQGSTTMRNTPDVALTADNVYVRADGLDYSVGGTSCAAPLWAGFAALANQQAADSGRPAVGFINPAVDRIGNGVNYAFAFHDITNGNNTSSSSPTRFYAVPGYDLCTGWGTPAGTNLINALAEPENLVITPSSGFTAIGPASGPFTNTSQSFTLTSMATNSLNWTLVNTSRWLTASSSGGTLEPGGPATTVTVTLNAAASNLVAGTYNATVWFTNLDSGIGQDRQFTLFIDDPLQITPATGFAAVGPLGGPFKVTSQSFSLINLGTASLNWSLVNTSRWLSASPNGGTLTSGGPPATVTVSLTAAAGTNSFGIYAADIWFTNEDNYIGQMRQFTLNIGHLPVITLEPTNQTVPSGGSATFDVLVSGAGPYTCQWQLNGTNLPADIITTVAGEGSAGYLGDGGQATHASLSYPAGVAVGGSGNLFIADTGNNCVREVGTNGLITTVVGDGRVGYLGDGGPATNASLDAPSGVAVDGSGNLFVADTYNNRIRKVDVHGVITTVAGDGNTGYSGDGGAATNASLFYPTGVAVDNSGRLFVADIFNNRIRRVGVNGLITTVAGNGSAGYSGDGGLATNASLDTPSGVTVDSSGDLFIADTYNDSIREVDTNGIISTVDSDGSPGYSGASGLATSATLSYPASVVVDGSGNLFTADTGNNRIREINPGGIITTVAGDGIAGYSGDGGVATNASLDASAGVAVDGSGNLFIADTDNNRIREVVAGSPTITLKDVSANDVGNYALIIANAWGSVTSSVATLTVLLPPAITGQPGGLTVTNGGPASFGVTVSGTAPLVCQWQKNGVNLADGGSLSGSATTNLFLSSATTNDAGNYKLIITNAWGSVTSGVATLTVVLPPVINRQPESLTVTNGSPAGFAVQASGTAPLVFRWQKNGMDLTDGGSLSGSATTNLFLSFTTTNDAGHYSVIIANPWGGATSSVASLTIVVPPPMITRQPTSQMVLVAGKATLGVSVSGAGPYTYQWQLNGTNLPDDIITTVAGNGGTSNFGDGGVATNASLHAPASVAVDGSGNLFIADTDNNAIREVGTNGLITTVAGNGRAGYSGDGGVATHASLSFPTGVAVDGSGNLFIADTGNNSIREVGTNGLITTVAGNGTAGYSGDGNMATNASLDVPSAVTVDGSGNLFIADTDNHCIREVGTNGLITTVAGDGSAGYAGDGGLATNATLDVPTGVTLDRSGNLFIADTGNNSIREVGTNGVITTVAGDGSAGYSGDGGLATNATLDASSGVAVDGSGNLFIADIGNNSIREVGTNGVIATVAGDGIAGYSGDGGLATNATLDAPANVVLDGSGNLFIADTGNNRIREVVAGAPTFTLNDVTANDAGYYTVVIANPWGSVTSIVATITVVLPPAITGQPAGLTVTNGSPASFGVTISGTAPLVCRWQKNGTNLTDGGSLFGSATTNLFLSSATTTDAGNYTVIITNAWGSVTSSVATLTVVLPPVITRQPESLTVTNGSPASFGVTVSGTAPLVYQWQKNGTNLTDGGSLSGSTTTNLFLSSTKTNDAGNYSVVIANAWGSVTSSVAGLIIVIPPPMITRQPTSQMVVAAGRATLSVSVAGAGPYTYQWQLNGTNLPDDIITTVAGNGGTNDFGDGGAATNA
ncbi:MAG: immunoglobulin domain-containing protein, partial [Verrucomicrobiota bacterium]